MRIVPQKRFKLQHVQKAEDSPTAGIKQVELASNASSSAINVHHS